MKFKVEQKDSGLMVATQGKPKPKETTKHAKIEIQDEDKREIAKEAMSMLWQVMELSYFDGRESGIQLPNDDGTRMAAHYHAWCHLGAILLGDDCPAKEMYT